MKSHGTNPGGRVATVLAPGTACPPASVIAVRATAAPIADTAPQVGTLIRFAPAGQPGLPKVQMGARRRADGSQPARTCTLSERLVKAYGGSLIVQARDARTGEPLAHRAGARTALGPEDCGRTAVPRLRTDDMRALAEAASGLSSQAAAAQAHRGGSS